MFLSESGIFDPWFNVSLLMTNISLMASFIFILVSIKIIEKSKFLKIRLINYFWNFNLRRDRMIICAILFLFLFFISFIQLTKNFGFVNWIMDPRTGYQFFRSGSGHWYASSILFLSISYSILLINYKKIFNLTLIFFVYSLIVFSLGSKILILSFAISFLTVLWIRKVKYLNLFISISIFFGFFLVLKNFNANELIDIVSYFDMYTIGAMYYKAYFQGEIDLFYGYIWLTSFYEYLPRAIFENKPYVYGIIYINEYFFPGMAELTHTPHFGRVVESFADFGLIGILLFSIINPLSFLNTLALYIFFRNTNIDGIKSNSAYFLLFLILFAPSFLVYFGFFYKLILIIFTLCIIYFVNRFRWH